MNKRPIRKSTLAVLALLIVACCASQIGNPSNVLEVGAIPSDRINFPEECKYKNANFFVHNEIKIS
jgi:hypothetical protein